MNKPIEIGDGHQVVAFSAVGGTIVRWRYDDVDVLYPQGEILFPDGKKLRGGIPICFPNFGEAPEKFNLPKHGTLRTLDATHHLKDGMFFRNARLFGPMNDTECDVLTRIVLQPRGFEFSLKVTVLSSSAMPFINPGFHPYFATPQQEARVITAEESVLVTTPFGPEFKSMVQEIKVESKGVGTTVMHIGNGWRKQPTRGVVVWTDDPSRYTCAEAVYGKPEIYGSEACARLYDGFEMKCRFEFFPEGS